MGRSRACVGRVLFSWRPFHPLRPAGTRIAPHFQYGVVSFSPPRLPPFPELFPAYRGDHLSRAFVEGGGFPPCGFSDLPFAWGPGQSLLLRHISSAFAFLCRFLSSWSCLIDSAGLDSCSRVDYNTVTWTCHSFFWGHRTSLAGPLNFYFSLLSRLTYTPSLGVFLAFTSRLFPICAVLSRRFSFCPFNQGRLSPRTNLAGFDSRTPQKNELHFCVAAFDLVPHVRILPGLQ